MASASFPRLSPKGTGSISALKWLFSSITCSTLARCVPSTRTLTVPSGSLSICKILAILPTRYKSSTVGSSLAAAFCATKTMLLPISMADSKALIDFERPTNNGITMCGNTTTSRKGSNGNKLETSTSVS